MAIAVGWQLGTRLLIIIVVASLEMFFFVRFEYGSRYHTIDMVVQYRMSTLFLNKG